MSQKAFNLIHVILIKLPNKYTEYSQTYCQQFFPYKFELTKHKFQIFIKYIWLTMILQHFSKGIICIYLFNVISRLNYNLKYN